MTTFNRSAILKAAHFTAKWRVASVGGSYRKWLGEALAHEWKKASDAKTRRERAALNDRLNIELNTGLPIRSCPADAPARLGGVFANVRPARRLFTTHSGRIAGSFGA